MGRAKKFRLGVFLSIFVGIVALGIYLSLGAGQSMAEAQKGVYKGIAYSATRGGHLVFTEITIDPDRDFVSGSIAGRMPIPNNEQADAIEMSLDQKYLYYPTWDTSTLYVIDISERKNPKVVAEKKVFDKPTRFCGSVIGPDGKLYLSSMSQGDVHKYDISDPKDPKLMDRLYKATYLCGVQVIEDGKYIWTTDMKESKVYIYDAMTNNLLKEINIGNANEFIHRSRLSVDKKYLYQSSSGSKPPAPANGRVYIIDTKKQKIKETIVLGAGYDIHDVATTPDGKYAIAAVRRVPTTEMKDSEYVVINLNTKKVIGSISMCKGCHNAMGVDPKISKEREVFICGIQIAWEK